MPIPISRRERMATSLTLINLVFILPPLCLVICILGCWSGVAIPMMALDVSKHRSTRRSGKKWVENRHERSTTCYLQGRGPYGRWELVRHQAQAYASVRGSVPALSTPDF